MPALIERHLQEGLCTTLRCHTQAHILRIGHNRIYIYTIYDLIFGDFPVPKIPYLHRIDMVLANPTQFSPHGKSERVTRT
jgi:hypothetical protein